MSGVRIVFRITASRSPSTMSLLTSLIQARARAARYDPMSRRIVVQLTNGCEFAFPAEFAQGLAGANPADLQAVEVTPPGDGLHWEALDVDILVAQLAIGIFGSKAWTRERAREAGRKRTAKKAAAARANGAKGGRPRKVRPAA
jgi:hypothetical protein